MHSQQELNTQEKDVIRGNTRWRTEGDIVHCTASKTRRKIKGRLVVYYNADCVAFCTNCVSIVVVIRLKQRQSYETKGRNTPAWGKDGKDWSCLQSVTKTKCAEWNKAAVWTREDEEGSQEQEIWTEWSTERWNLARPLTELFRPPFSAPVIPPLRPPPPPPPPPPSLSLYF